MIVINNNKIRLFISSNTWRARSHCKKMEERKRGCGGHLVGLAGMEEGVVWQAYLGTHSR
jgi:hypothetical protein